ncbi:MAG: tetratricopeptide repeat protein [Patescibacteria group bacterium]|jgi:tetratricopeptide (TPR) repeat protein|nr:tetratricopeptide repeat protein [Patescibacteria group bacterium]
MTGLIALIIIGALVIRAVYTNYDELDEIPEKLGNQLGKLWEIAHQGMRENKLLRAEKALLTILKIDEKNAAAYNRLGILYAKQKEYADAIDCFEIASSIEISASSLHNLGLIYYETGNYTKAAVAFEDAIQLEGDLATRHIAYAKCLEKLGNNKKMISELEKACELEPTRETMLLLQKAYELNGDSESAYKIQKSINKTHSTVGRPKKVNRPKRVVV